MLYVAWAVAANAVEPDRALIEPYATPVSPMLANFSADAGQCRIANSAPVKITAPRGPTARAMSGIRMPRKQISSTIGPSVTARTSLWAASSMSDRVAERKRRRCHYHSEQASC